MLKIAASRSGVNAAGVGIDIERLMVALAARMRKENTVGDLMQPCRKAGFIAERVEFAPRNDEGFLREIVCKRLVAVGKPAQQTTNGRLMSEHELIEGAGVALNKCASDKLGIIGFHGFLWLRRGAVILLAALDFPDDDVANPHDQRDHTQAPGAVVMGEEEDGNADACRDE